MNPHTLAVDAAGRLWATNASNEILAFEPSSLDAGAAVTPSIVIRNP